LTRLANSTGIECAIKERVGESENFIGWGEELQRLLFFYKGNPMLFHHALFEHIFSRIFVYNMLFEDSDVDCRYLRLDSTDRVLSISGGGCGVAALLAFQPESIDVVDSNLAHLSLAAVKMLAPRYLSYEDFYQLLGYGKTERAREFLDVILHDEQIPDAIRRYWQKNEHIFTSRGLYRSGLTAWMTQRLTRLCGITRQWMEDAALLPVEERLAVIDREVCQRLRSPWVKVMLGSPLQLLSAGVNFRQKQKVEREFQTSFAGRIYPSRSALDSAVSAA
jgi:S-adenosylmethionine-diacylglycerol 3-amino-3-carboxypropyl transferase